MGRLRRTYRSEFRLGRLFRLHVDWSWLDDGCSMYSKHRVEALSDGVFAIAMTLLVLDLKVPTASEPGQLWSALQADWHEWVSFAITFTLAATFWTFQHQVFDLVKKIDRISLALTFLFLGFVSVLPFTTSLWGHHIKEPLAFVLYFGNQLALAATLTAKLEVARFRGDIEQGPAADKMRLRLSLMCLIMAVGALSATFVPLHMMSLPILVVGIGTNLFRRWYAKKMERRVGAGSPPALVD